MWGGGVPRFAKIEYVGGPLDGDEAACSVPLPSRVHLFHDGGLAGAYRQRAGCRYDIITTTSTSPDFILHALRPRAPCVYYWRSRA